MDWCTWKWYAFYSILLVFIILLGTSHWNLAQWNNPTNFTTSAVTNSQGPCATPNAKWHKSNENARVCMAPSSSGNNYVELAQNGSTNLKCGVEYDLFIGANNTAINLYGNLTSFDALTFNFSLNLLNASVSARCGTFPQVIASN
jgi:hypothetical protein